MRMIEFLIPNKHVTYCGNFYLKMGKVTYPARLINSTI